MDPADELHPWLVREFTAGATPGELLGALVERLSDLQLCRVNWIQPTLHPLIRANTFIWRRGHEVETLNHGYETVDEDTFKVSPLRVLFDEAVPVRRRICDPQAPNDFPILDELRSEGGTDYLAIPVTLGISPIGMTWATTRAGGFSDVHVGVLERLAPTIATLLDTDRTRRAAETMLEVYVGRHAAQRIIRGDIRRGEGSTTRAVVWFSDLRGYSRLSATMPAAELIGLLNGYFEHMAGAVQTFGGEVLKFLGDGLLAVFRDDDDAARAKRAVDAAMQALERVEHLPDALTIGITMHIGDVVYGNIGAPDRLDFTVIGPAVNQVARMQGVCDRAGHHVLVSKEISSLLERETRPLGVHQLRGVGDAELFEVSRLR